MDCFKCCKALWHERGVIHHFDVFEINLITATRKEALKEGFLKAIGPSEGQVNRVFVISGSRASELNIFKGALRLGTYGSRKEICSDCVVLPLCCIKDEALNCLACLVDLCLVPYFCYKRSTYGSFFCGASLGDCFNFPKDLVYYVIKGVYLPLRCCCFETIGPGKQGCIPFPMVDEAFYSADCEQCFREGRTWSEEARKENAAVIAQQPKMAISHQRSSDS